MSRAGWLGALVVVLALIYGIMGGEYSTFDWLALRRQEKAETQAIARLTAEVDSLKRYARRVQTDRRLMEQLARENFGMIRRGEFLYRLETDSLDAQ